MSGAKTLLRDHLRECHSITMEGETKQVLSRTHGTIHSEGNPDHTHPPIGSPAERLVPDYGEGAA